MKVVVLYAENKYFCHKVSGFLPPHEVSAAVFARYISQSSIMSKVYSNSELFLDAFNQIEQHLSNRFRPGFHVGFTELVRRMQAQDVVVKRFAVDLREYAELRNAIVHNRRANFVIAEPHDEVVKEILRIRDLILNPPTIKALPRREVYTVTRKTLLVDALTTFGREGFTRCPVVEENRVTGLLTARSIARWLASMAANFPNLNGYTIESVFPWTQKEKFAVVRGDMQLHGVYELFKGQLHSGGSLQAVLITPSGKPILPVHGIITASDLPGIFDLLDKDQGE